MDRQGKPGELKIRGQAEAERKDQMDVDQEEVSDSR